MAVSPKSLTLKGRLLFIPDGKSTEDGLELGELEIPIQIGYQRPPTIRGNNVLDSALRGPE